MHYEYLETPVGRLLVAGDAAGLRHVLFDDARQASHIRPDWRRGHAQLDAALVQLDEWFAGRRQQFDLPLAAAGTAFRKQVWAELTRIPYGHTLSYGELARRIGQPRASRAVGAANGANPLPIVVPCHRVIGADGRLTGFGGGLPVKRWLLDHERCCLAPA
ncbi:methylated-DNA--[protein]-cysteine S-methyltransferase [Dokdonella sp.]|uniref:methylated-DNA--[protein]-cysteine S-methyltransferase n=1 Tax=Dokdonella sp. TaxID=2291710 RepID=UPI0031C5C607|nr:methylated-DNA--[protein]-cysteine S-methyltransferase [Dokdonella sp.]